MLAAILENRRSKIRLQAQTFDEAYDAFLRDEDADEVRRILSRAYPRQVIEDNIYVAMENHVRLEVEVKA